MLREVVIIDEEKCDGCGLCIPSCAEGAIKIIDGKAKLVDARFCDGMGACLGKCPLDAITVEQRDVPEFDEELVKVHLAKETEREEPHHCACPGSAARSFEPEEEEVTAGDTAPFQLTQWPIQLHLVSPFAEYYQSSAFALVADCCAFATNQLHNTILKGKSLAIACPKLDTRKEMYVDKMVKMITDAGITDMTVVIMEVPCCGGLVQLAQTARSVAGTDIPINVIVIGINGKVLKEIEI